MLLRTIVGQPIVDKLIIMQAPCNEAQLHPLIDTRLCRVVICEIRTTTCIQLSTTASIPRSYLHLDAPQQQQQQQPQHHGATSYTSPPPPYGDVAEVTSGDDVIVVASDSELKDEE